VAKFVRKETPTLQEALKAYENKRKLLTTKLAFNSRVLGAVETVLPEFARDAFFRTTAALGVAEFVYLDGAVPSVLEV